METLKVQMVGNNSSGYTVYRDESGKFYLDISLEVQNPDTLYHCNPSDDMDGEPDYPLKEKFEILNPFTEKELKMHRFQSEYVMLSRLKGECEAFVGKTGNEKEDKWDCRYHNVIKIWGNTIEEEIAEIKRLWNKIPEDIKPQWCTAEEIAELERKAMAVS